MGDLSKPSRLALRFFALSVMVFFSAGMLALALIAAGRPPKPQQPVLFPAVFWLSTVLLIAGSVVLHRSLQQIRREKQGPFRRSLLMALAAGTLFVGAQSYGLWCLLENQDPAKAETGVNAFVFAFAALHGLHFTIALLFLVFVTLSALAGRYDHEYYWGVTVCAYFWHFLGAAWGCILVVFAIALVPR